MSIYIKEIRKKKGISQKEMAEKLGVDSSYLARLESGNRALTNEWVANLTKALDCEAWELCDDVDYFFSKENIRKLFKDNVVFTVQTNTLNEQEAELLKIYGKLNIKDKARLILDAYNLAENSP